MALPTRPEQRQNVQPVRMQELVAKEDPIHGDSFYVVDPWGTAIGYVGDARRVIHNRGRFDIFSAGPDRGIARICWNSRAKRQSTCLRRQGQRRRRHRRRRVRARSGGTQRLPHARQRPDGLLRRLAGRFEQLGSQLELVPAWSLKAKFLPQPRRTITRRNLLMATIIRHMPPKKNRAQQPDCI